MLTESGLVDQILGDGGGLVVCPVDLLDHHATLAVELLRIDPRARHEVAQQVDRLLSRLGSHGDVEGDEVVAGVRVEHTADLLSGLVDVPVRGVLLAALEDQMLQEMGHPVLLRTLGAGAGVKGKQHRQRARAGQRYAM